jgi:hypothetical protein
MSDPELYRVGMRLRLARDWDYYPLGSFPAGTTGTLIAVDLTQPPDLYVAVLSLDTHFDALTEWENCVYIYRSDHPEAAFTTELFDIVAGPD